MKLLRTCAAAWALAVGLADETAHIYQSYDFRRPALIRRDIQIARIPLERDEFQLGFVRPCTAKHGLVLDSASQADVIQEAITDIRLVLGNPHEVSSQSKHSTNLELAHRLKWETDPLNLCVDFYSLRNPAELSDPGLLLPGSFFGHASKSPDEMAWHEIQRLSFEGCEAVFASPKTGLQNSTSIFKLRSLKANVKSTMGDVTTIKTKDENIVGHTMSAVSSSEVLFDLDSHMYTAAKNSKEIVLPWDILSRIARTCYQIQFNHNEALPALKSLVKRVYVPQWGDQLKLEETYQLINEAARMAGDYRGSDVNMAMRRLIGTRRSHDFALTGSPILFTVDARIPRSGKEFEYYDSIGNVSTSHVSTRQSEYVIELEPRYPVLGGWSFGWTIKYLMPSKLWIDSEAPHTYRLAIPWSATVSGMWADSVTAEVLLPPRSKVTDVKSPRKAVDNMQMLTTRSWLDLFTTRPVIQLEWSNVPVLSTNKNVLLAEIEFVTDPVTSAILHGLWFPAIVAMVLGLIMIQPLTQKFFDFLTKLVEGGRSAQPKSVKASFFEALVALGDLFRLYFRLSKNEKVRSKAPGADVYINRAVEALGNPPDETLVKEITQLSDSYKQGLQSELATLERRVIKKLAKSLDE